MSQEDGNPENEKKPNSSIPGWMVALGLGTTIAITTAATVYIIKSRRDEELRALRYGVEETERNPSGIFDSKTISSYWNMTVVAFNTTKSIVMDWFKTTPNKNTPFVQSSDIPNDFYEDDTSDTSHKVELL